VNTGLRLGREPLPPDRVTGHGGQDSLVAAGCPLVLPLSRFRIRRRRGDGLLKRGGSGADTTHVTVTDTGLPRLAVDPELRSAVERLCEPGMITAVVQPIVRPADMVVVGYEALARMIAEPHRPPDWWLDVASAFGLRQRLERACLLAAAALGNPPHGRVLFVNASPSTVADPLILALRDELPHRLVIELTEQEAVEDYDGLRRQLAGWLSDGDRRLSQPSCPDAGGGGLCPRGGNQRDRRGGGDAG
jgi:hypothetical protein